MWHTGHALLNSIMFLPHCIVVATLIVAAMLIVVDYTSYMLCVPVVSALSRQEAEWGYIYIAIRYSRDSKSTTYLHGVI